MLQALIAKKVINVILKKIMEKREIKKIKKYVEEPNDADDRIDQLELKVHRLEKDSHKPQEFICCRKCGCKINKAKRKKK